MQIFFIIGGVAGWLIISIYCGKLMPALALPTIVAVIVGGVAGSIVGPLIFSRDK